MKNQSTDKQASKQVDKPLVVGLGASAGGLEPLKIFFDSLPEKTGMAFIVIVHLSPEHKSSMAGLLQEHTSLKVIQVNETVEIKQDCVYVIPPNKMLSVGDNHLELSKLEKNDHKPEVVDRLFRSLGTVKGENSVCITLSGTGSDGCLGLKAVKEHGGLVIAQDPNEAKYSGMPESAIKTGLVEKVLPVGEMAKELMDYKKKLGGDRISDHPFSLPEDKEEVLSKILAQVRSKTEHDFTHYKRSTVLRRIERRMHINHVDTLAGYLSFLKDHPNEAQELFKDLLITVTNFFRDPEAFKAVENKVIPKLFKDKGPDDELRVWVPGCATGEEAYSIAMLLREYAGTMDDSPQIQVFATDVDEGALNHARQGRYAESITADLTEQRLHRFFTKTGNEYRVNDELRDMVLFARHNLLGSPPFSNQDMISCRNLLIYLDRELQGEVFNLFHYALKPEGLLFLGNSDSNLEATELFTPLDKKYRIYRQSSRTQSKVHLPDIPLRFDKNQFSASHSWKMPSKTKTNFERLHRMLMTRQYAPPSVIINENDDVLHATGDINSYLKYTSGEPSRNILEMVIPELRRPLRSILYQAKKDGNELPVCKQLQVNLNDERQLIELNVQKIKEKDFPDDLRYVVFRKMDKGKSPVDGNIAKKRGASDEEVEIIEELENELKHTKEQLQITAEDYETSNEELRASNEELKSMNEELQSTTEELETSQEELQSVNEELKTVNQELESKIDSLSQANNDLKNLMDSSEIGILFVDREYRVKRFTTQATKIFNLTPS
ncbi:MAG TPA: CheR family methyltransferase, partial [Balneolaceae bacterium]|nr:CheR family methyltransferase [Balneolaceae bacterium]